MLSIAENEEPCKVDEWLSRMNEWHEQKPLVMEEKEKLVPKQVIDAINEYFDEPIVTTDVGQNQMWTTQFLELYGRRQMLTSGGLGTMGYGLGAAIGAQIGNPDKQVINIAGDGCFRMNMNEIATAAREKLPLIEVIVNNHVLGMVRQWQDLFYEKRYSATVLDDGVDFVKLAEAMGAKGYRVTSQEEFKEAFKEALESEVPVLIDCIINCDDKVWPMVAPGEAISSSFTGEDLAKKQ